MTANQERLDQITARAQTATPGPWLAADEHGLIPGAEPKWCVSRMDGVKWLYDVAETVCDDEQVNAEFIAAAREDVPWLLSVVRDQAEQIAALQERIAAQNKWARSSMAGVVAGREAMRAERDALQDRIDKALAWLDEADPLPELNGDMFRDLRNYLTVDVPTEGELT